MNPEIIREAGKYLTPVKNGSKVHQYQAVRIMNELPEGHSYHKMRILFLFQLILQEIVVLGHVGYTI